MCVECLAFLFMFYFLLTSFFSVFHGAARQTGTLVGKSGYSYLLKEWVSVHATYIHIENNT